MHCVLVRARERKKGSDVTGGQNPSAGLPLRGCVGRGEGDAEEGERSASGAIQGPEARPGKSSHGWIVTVIECMSGWTG